MATCDSTSGFTPRKRVHLSIPELKASIAA